MFCEHNKSFRSYDLQHRATLEHELLALDDHCFVCHEHGHLARFCPSRAQNVRKQLRLTHAKARPRAEKIAVRSLARHLQRESNNDDDDDDDDVCFRCGRPSHWIADCYAAFDVDGYEINRDSDAGSGSDAGLLQKFEYDSKKNIA